MVGDRTVLQTERDQGGPPGLVRRPTTPAVVAMKVLVEEQQIPPVGVGGKTRVLTLPGAPSILVGEKDAGQTGAKLLGYLIEGHHRARAGWAFHQEGILVKV